MHLIKMREIMHKLFTIVVRIKLDNIIKALEQCLTVKSQGLW